MASDGIRDPGPTSIPCAVLAYGHDLEDVQAIIDAATMIARHQIGRGRVPPLYRSGVVYRREEHRTLPGVERVNSPEETFAMGGGDCDDLAPWRAAELQLQGENARARVVQSPGIGYHVVVVRGDGSIEDPSARLGMREVSMGATQQRSRARRLAGSMLDRARDITRQAASVYDPRQKAAMLREGLRLASKARRTFAQLEADDGPDDEDDSEAVEGVRPAGLVLERVLQTFTRPKP